MHVAYIQIKFSQWILSVHWCASQTPSPFPPRGAAASLGHLPTKCLYLLSSFNVQITVLNLSLRPIKMIYFERALKSSKLLSPSFVFWILSIKSITFKDEVTTQPFWGNKKDLKGVSLLVPNILNRLEIPKKSQSSREKHKHPRSAATGDLHFTASKRSFEGQKVKELHLALPISVRYYQPFHHTSQIWKIFHHQQAQETSSDKISAHQTVYNLKMLDNCSKCTFFFVSSFNQQECSQ